MDEPPVSDLDEAETRALIAAVDEALADPRAVPHEEMRVWLQKIAAGNFSSKPPVPRIL